MILRKKRKSVKKQMEVEQEMDKTCFVIQSHRLILDKINPQFLTSIDVKRIVLQGANYVISFNVAIKLIDGHFVMLLNSDDSRFETFVLIFKTAEDVNAFIATFKQQKKRYIQKSELLTFFFTIAESIPDFYLEHFDFLSAKQVAVEKQIRELRAEHAAMQSVAPASSSSSTLPTMIGGTEVY